MRFSKTITLFFLTSLLLPLVSVNAAVDYQRRPAEHNFKRHLPPDYSDQRDPIYDKSVSKQSELYVQEKNSQELKKLKNELIEELLTKTRELSDNQSFDENIAEYVEAVDSLMQSRLIASSPYRSELLKMLGAHKKAVIDSANKNYFLSEKMIFDSLDNKQGKGESNLQMAFRNGMRMSEDSFDILRNMRPDGKSKLKFDREFLKILLIQALSNNHVKCGNRRQCLEQDQRLLDTFRSVVPPSAQFGSIISGYSKDLTEKSAMQSALPIILREIQKMMNPAEWKALLDADPSLADRMVSDQMEWDEITQQEPRADIIYPWTDPTEEEATHAKKKAEAGKQAALEASKKEEKGFLEKGTDDLKAKLKSQAGDQAKNLLGGLFGNANNGGSAGAAANPLKGLFG